MMSNNNNKEFRFWLSDLTPPRRNQDRFWELALNGPDPTLGRWVQSKIVNEHECEWRYVSGATFTLDNAVLTQTGWEFTGVLPTYDYDREKWIFAGESPELFYRAPSQVKILNFRVSKKGTIYVAPLATPTEQKHSFGAAFHAVNGNECMQNHHPVQRVLTALVLDLQKNLRAKNVFLYEIDGIHYTRVVAHTNAQHTSESSSMVIPLLTIMEQTKRTRTMNVEVTFPTFENGLSEDSGNFLGMAAEMLSFFLSIQKTAMMASSVP